MYLNGQNIHLIGSFVIFSLLILFNLFTKTKNHEKIITFFVILHNWHRNSSWTVSFWCRYQGGAAPSVGNSATMTTCAFGGEYQTVTGVIAGDSYVITYTGGTTGNFVTLYDNTFTPIAFGVSPVTFVAPAAGTFYSQSNSTGGACATENACHTAVWQNNGIPPCPLGVVYQGGIAPTVGNSTTTTTCAFGGEYQTVTGVVAGDSYVITYTGGTTGNFVTLYDNIFTPIAAGVSPLSWTATGSGTYYSQSNGTGAGCPTENLCHTNIWDNNTPCPVVNGTDTRSECNPFTWIDGINYTANNNVATFTLSAGAANGCDSIVTLDLTINTSPVIVLDPFITDTVCISNTAIQVPVATPTGGTYSGLGVVDTTFNPATAGAGTHYILYSYTDGNSCTSTDSTMIVVNLCTGINENTSLNNVNIYPNPTNGLVHVNLGNHNGSINYTISTIEGKIVNQENNVTTNKMTINLTNESKGIYLLMIEDNTSSKVYKIIRE